MKLKCRKCGMSEITLARDRRGLVEAHCGTCKSFIKKMTVGEVSEYYEEELAALKGNGTVADVNLEVIEPPAPKQMCRYCTEYYAMRKGRFGSIYQPIDAKFCPMCGRELLPSDRDY